MEVAKSLRNRYVNVKAISFLGFDVIKYRFCLRFGAKMHILTEMLNFLKILNQILLNMLNKNAIYIAFFNKIIVFSVQFSSFESIQPIYLIQLSSFHFIFNSQTFAIAHTEYRYTQTDIEMPIISCD